MMHTEVVVAGAVRTPIGKFGGSFVPLKASDLGVSVADQQTLVNAIDVWWLYARYAGLPAAPLTAAALALLAAAIAATVATRRAAAAEEAARA